MDILKRGKNIMKLTKKQIETIRANTREELKGYHQALRQTLGYFTPYGANWSFCAGWTYEGDLVVTRFGEVI